MKFMHLADLHLGKVVYGYNMIEDQKYTLNKIIEILVKQNIKVLLIAGDIYQSPVAQTDAINLFSDFLYQLSKLDIKVLIISGNHDSADRLSYGSELLKNANIHISKAYNGEVEKIEIDDEYGKVNFYLLPYIKPDTVRAYFKNEDINNFEEALSSVIEKINIDKKERNIILSHQYIRDAEMGSSEQIYAGDVEAISKKVYEKFDYTALGHIHKKQTFNDGKIRYPGALLKYDSNESSYHKTISIVEIKNKGELKIEEINTPILRDMRKIRGKFDEILDFANNDLNKDDYIHIELLDKENQNAYQIFKEIYPHLMTLKYIENQNGENKIEEILLNSQEKTPFELFESFYIERTNEELSDNQKQIMKQAIDEVWGRYETD